MSSDLRSATPAANGHRHRPTGPSIALFGLFGVGNLGNDHVVARAVVTRLRTIVPEARLSVITGEPANMPADLDLPAVNLRPEIRSARRLTRLLMRTVGAPVQWFGVWRWLRQHDVLVVPGTGVLDDFGDRIHDMPFHLFMWMTLARARRLKIHFVSIGAGPINHPVSRRLMGAAIKCATTRTFRDRPSADFVRDLIGGGDEPVVPDVVFGLDRPAVEAGRQVVRPRTVGVGLMTYYGWTSARERTSPVYRAYIDRMATIVEGLLGAGYGVHLFHGEGGDVHAINDTMASVALHDIAPDALRGIVRTEATTFDELMAAISATDLTVVTRFHNVVASLMMARPVISIGYAQKNIELMNDFGLAPYAHDIDRLQPEVVLEQVAEMFERAGPICRSILERNEQIVGELDSEYTRLAALLGGTTSTPTHTRFPASMTATVSDD